MCECVYIYTYACLVPRSTRDLHSHGRPRRTEITGRNEYWFALHVRTAVMIEYVFVSLVLCLDEELVEAQG